MKQKYLFPAIDLRAGKVVRLMKGAYDQQTTYGDDPAAQAQAFADAGATWVHVVDLDGARSGEMTQLEVIERVCKIRPPTPALPHPPEKGGGGKKLKIEVGGGVRSEAVIDELLGVGVERVVLGTAALTRWDWFEKLVAQNAYRNRLVLGLDAKAGKLAVSGWETQTSATPIEIARRVTGWPLAAIVYTDIATDGTMKGPNVEATGELAAATDVPVVASGGVGTLAHLRALRELPVQGAIVGRALYENAFTVGEALAVFERG